MLRQNTVKNIKKKVKYLDFLQQTYNRRDIEYKLNFNTNVFNVCIIFYFQTVFFKIIFILITRIKNSN